jgi:hypothetical protein
MPRKYADETAEDGMARFRIDKTYETEEQFQTATNLESLLAQELKTGKDMCIAKITIYQDMDTEHKTMIFEVNSILTFMHMFKIMEKSRNVTVLRNILSLYGLHQVIYNYLDKESTGFIITGHSLDPKIKYTEPAIVYPTLKDLIESLPAEKPDEYHVYCVTNIWPKRSGLFSNHTGNSWTAENFEIIMSDLFLSSNDYARLGPAWLRLEHVKACYNQGKIRYMAINDPCIEVRIEAIKRLDFTHNPDRMPIIESVILNILADDVPACQLALLQNQRLLRSEKLRKLILKISAKFEEPAISEVAKTLMEE